MSQSERTPAGVSGMAVYLPPLRVPLESWCAWTGNPWAKVRSVVGRSFRCCAPDENAYTMAAGAVLRLIQRYEVDPGSVGLLALGTESSTDNSAGAVIVRGMVDRALERLGRPRLSRNLEVPELKHACLGGVYGVKNAVRYLQSDGAGRRAIVVCSDIAEYERGSTGEQTQGAGAVALLLEQDPRLFELDLEHAGSASDYRGPDFRKPKARLFADGYAPQTRRLHDFPVFSGKYSTFAYLDETVRAVDEMARRLGTDPLDLYRDSDALFFHRPYHHMPVQAMAYLYLRALARSPRGASQLQELCAAAGASAEAVVEECRSAPDLFSRVLAGSAEEDPYPATSAAAAHLRRSPEFKALLEEKMSLGSEAAMDLGNLYTAALFAWMAAGFEDALCRDVELSGRRLLAIGYGSGDAAEAIPIRVANTWREASARIGFSAALEGAVDLTRSQYEALHDTGKAPDDLQAPRTGFRVTRLGDRNDPAFQDLGVEYYEYLSS